MLSRPPIGPNVDRALRRNYIINIIGDLSDQWRVTRTRAAAIELTTTSSTQRRRDRGDHRHHIEQPGIRLSRASGRQVDRGCELAEEIAQAQVCQGGYRSRPSTSAA